MAFEFGFIGFFLEFGLVALIIWLLIAFWPARVAKRRGYSFLGFFILSLFFFPLALLLAYLLPNRLKESSDDQGHQP